MDRRTDNDTAEKVSLALLTKAAFGMDAGVHVALYYALPGELVTTIFGRHVGQLRKDVQDVFLELERRRLRRQSKDFVPERRRVMR
jgi:hypothetical protein